MKKGDQITGPAFVRHKYKGEWEYALLHQNLTFSPFGKSPPRGTKWVWQRTWKNTLQKIHVVTPEDLESLGQGYVPEWDCWWNNLGKLGDATTTKHDYPIAFNAHAGSQPPLEK